MLQSESRNKSTEHDAPSRGGETSPAPSPAEETKVEEKKTGDASLSAEEKKVESDQVEEKQDGDDGDNKLGDKTPAASPAPAAEEAKVEDPA